MDRVLTAPHHLIPSTQQFSVDFKLSPPGRRVNKDASHLLNVADSSQVSCAAIDVLIFGVSTLLSHQPNVFRLPRLPAWIVHAPNLNPPP